MDFPASNLSKFERDADGRFQILVKFLGLLGPQGALPLATTEEAYSWNLMRDDAFPRFLDLLNHRFLQLFFRAWADARPIAQHDRPEADRFHRLYRRDDRDRDAAASRSRFGAGRRQARLCRPDGAAGPVRLPPDQSDRGAVRRRGRDRRVRRLLSDVRRGGSLPARRAQQRAWHRYAHGGERIQRRGQIPRPHLR